ncbi:Fatty acid oxidation complex subunit alpha [compost metagenome]
MSTLNLSVDSDGVALIVIDLIDRPINVFTPEFVNDLSQAVEQILAREDIKGAVLTSGKQGFIAGADLKDLVNAYEQGVSPSDAATRFNRENALFRRIETGGKPFVAALNGQALGGGLELALACHHRVLASHPKALVGLPEVTVGLLAAGGGTQRLPRLIGVEKALPLLLEGTLLKPEQALEVGIIDELVPPFELLEKSRQWVLEHPHPQQPWDIKGFTIAGGSGPLAEHAGRSFTANMAQVRKRTQDNYPAPLAILSAVYEGTQLPFDLAIQVEAKYFAQLLANPVARNLMRTLFINKGRADKLARRPQGIAPLHISRLAVLGAGMMGVGIARVAAAAGIQVVLLDNNLQAAERGKEQIAQALEKDRARRGGSQDAVDAQLARILATEDYSQLSHCELVIEAVFEERTVKAQVIQRAEEHLPASAIFASNTSTLPISGLAELSQRPTQFIGIHFFSPVERMPLVEVILGKETSKATLAHALDFVALLRKTPIVVNDSPGFYTSRIFCSYIDEGMAMLAEGIAPALIENAARMAGLATGPLAVTDEVSLDLQKKVVDQAISDGLSPERQRQHAQPVINRFNTLGRLGRKTGGGFYEFPVGGRKHLWSGLTELYPTRAEQPEVQEVIDRLLYIQALESARCVEEGVITDAMDADLGAILGLGFPGWAGGPLSFIDTLGLAPFVERCKQLASHHPRFQPSAWLIQRAALGKNFY